MKFPDPLSIAGWMWAAWYIYWMIAAWSAAPTKWSEAFWKRFVYLLPMVGGFFLIFHGPGLHFIQGEWVHARAVRYVGPVVTAVGLSFAIWARVHLGRYWSGTVTLKDGHRLIRTGPYRLVRHPIYTGFLIGVIGAAVAAGTWDALAGFFPVLLGCWIKIRREEGVMVREFGDEYVRFRNEIPALVPRPWGKAHQ